ncbi:MAG: ATP-NAD kinase family protein [Promethearchaeota archaeon]|jgi:predicted polyphosphate/ATP-dependent NAD kinase
MKKVGLIVNPIAGMGGSVGLKGTDGDTYKQALKMGATPVAPSRMNQFFSHLKHKEICYFFVAPGKMGEDLIKTHKYKFEVVGKIGIETTSEDTIRIAKAMLKKKIELLIICGGDGTARDIYDAIDMKKPIIAIPSGVKMFSSVFALNPRAAAKLLDASLIENIDTEEREVLDINEESFRQGRLDSKLYGFLKVPKIQKLIQFSKDSSIMGSSVEENKHEIALGVIEKMEDDTLYLLGPGTTVKSITDQLQLNKTLLGVDAIYNKEFIGADLNEKAILKLLDKYGKVKIVVTPIGGQGFIFGRGNKQFTPPVIKKVGKENIIIISTKEKIRNLECLRVDTGDSEIDNLLKGLVKVVTGYKEEMIKKVK